jgi:hypothetical protein
MRRSAVLAILLVLALGGVAQATPPVASVTGTYSYVTNPDIPESSRTISLSARATEPIRGTFTSMRLDTVFTGTVTCLRVAGADAWLAGPVTSGGTVDAVFMWVHDAGAPGWAGDTAFTWFADPGETLADMEALCASMTTSPYGFDPFSVVSGNVTVHLAK